MGAGRIRSGICGKGLKGGAVDGGLVRGFLRVGEATGVGEAARLAAPEGGFKELVGRILK